MDEQLNKDVAEIKLDLREHMARTAQNETMIALLDSRLVALEVFIRSARKILPVLGVELLRLLLVAAAAAAGNPALQKILETLGASTGS